MFILAIAPELTNFNLLYNYNYFLFFFADSLLSQEEGQPSSIMPKPRIFSTYEEPSLVLPISGLVSPHQLSSGRLYANIDVSVSIESSAFTHSQQAATYLKESEQPSGYKQMENVSEESVKGLEEELEVELRQTYLDIPYPTLSPDLPNSWFDLQIFDVGLMLPISPVDVARNCEMSQYILLRGESGSGKRMFLCYLSKQWAERKLLNHFQLLFYVSEESCSDEPLKLLQKLKINTSVLIFLFEKSKHFQGIMKMKRRLSKATVIIVSKGTCTSNHGHQFQGYEKVSYDHQYQTVGFTKASLNNFIASSFHESDIAEQKFRRWIDTHPFASALIYRPLYCAMLVDMSKNCRFSDAIVNFTSLYREFIVCTIRKYSNSPIDYLSELKGSDRNNFEAILNFAYTCSASSSSLQPPENSLGLCNMSQNLFQSPFRHSSLATFLVELKNLCVFHDRSGWVNERRDVSNLFILGLKKNHEVRDRPTSYFYVSPLTAGLHAFECQSYTFPPVSRECKSPFLQGSEVFDPLNWYVYGWCLNNFSHNEVSFNYPFQTTGLERSICIQMLQKGSFHPEPLKIDVHKLTKEINGDSEMWDCLLQSSKETNVSKLIISDSLGTCFTGYSLSSSFPHIKQLEIKYKKWNDLFSSLPHLVFLETLIISNNEPLPCSFSTKMLSSVKACLSLKHLTFERMSTDFLESAFALFSLDPVMESLQSLCISSMTITQNCVSFLEKFVYSKKCHLHIIDLKHTSLEIPLFPCFEQFINCFLNSGVQTLHISGKGLISPSFALEMARVVEINLPLRGIKKLVLDDTSLKGADVAPLINVISRRSGNCQTKLILTLPNKYKYDFYSYLNLSFIEDISCVSLVDNIFLEPLISKCQKRHLQSVYDPNPKCQKIVTDSEMNDRT